MASKKIGAALWAPKCSFPECDNKVEYHTRFKKQDGSYGYNWKSMCEHHRNGSGKIAIDNWKLSLGCGNSDSRLGFECTGKNFQSHHLDVDHKDGNKLNRNPDNIQILCKLCHPTKTMINKDYLSRYSNRVDLSDSLFEVCP